MARSPAHPASQLISAGVALRQVQDWLGHSTIMTTMRYSHLAPGQQPSNLRGGRDLKTGPPTGQAWTSSVLDGHDAENRGLMTSADGPEWTGADLECRSVSALVAGALEALDRGDLAEAQALLRDVTARLARPGG